MITLFKDLLDTGPLLVLILLSLIAITKSTVDSMLLVISSIINEDILEKTLCTRLSERTRSTVMKIVVFKCALASILVAIAPEAHIIILVIEIGFAGISVIV